VRRRVARRVSIEGEGVCGMLAVGRNLGWEMVILRGCCPKWLPSFFETEDERAVVGGGGCNSSSQA
jgi:hypothetical protein